MSLHACRYAVIRFRPSAELEEFANIGIVLLSASSRHFGYRILENGTRRIFRFFDDVDRSLFRHARRVIVSELNRIRDMAQLAFYRNEGDYVQRIFDSLAVPSDSSMYFSPPKVLMANDPAEALDQLFERFVGRGYVGRSQEERRVESRVQSILAKYQLADKFERRVLGNEDFSVQFPMVSRRPDFPQRAIKPLYLAHDKPMDLYTHGWDWVGRIRGLHRSGSLPPHVLFAVHTPTDEDCGARIEASKDIIEQLRQVDDHIRVEDEVDEGKIREFAEAA